MITIVILCASLLAASGEPAAVEGKEKGKGHEAVKHAPAAAGSKMKAKETRKGEEAPKLDPTEALAQYNALKEKAANTEAAHWNLALWCERNGLPAEAFVHFTAVAMLNPTREAVWKKLGYKKHGGRWMTNEQVADDAVQKKADKTWGLKLRKIHKEIHRGKHRAEALDEVAAIEEPRAVPAVYREFGAGGQIDQTIAIQILGQIQSPEASKVLAILAIYGKTPEVRRHATETLRGRRTEDYLPLLVNLMADPIEYEVRPVGGPGSPGVLLVQGERFNVRRFYAPPAPNITVLPGDFVTYDNFGMPVINRPLGFEMKTGVPGSKTLVNDDELTMQFSVRDAMIEAQQGAARAQVQLQEDINWIEALNTVRNDFNEHVMNVAKDATGKDLGKKPKDWRTALRVRRGYEETSSKAPEKPTIDDLVPLAYLPQFGHLGFVRRIIVDS